MTRITAPEEWQQYKDHKYEYKRSSEDKTFDTFLNTITDGEGKLNVTGEQIIVTDNNGNTTNINHRLIPEKVIEICRVLDKFTGKEYLVYDVEQWGFMEEGGEQVQPIHIQDIGIYRQFNWVRKSNPMGVYTGSPQKRTFKWETQGYTEKYSQEWDLKLVNQLKKKSDGNTRLYVYDSSVSGRGGKSGKFAVDNWEDFTTRTFKELYEGTYILQEQLRKSINSAKLKEQSLEMERKTLQLENQSKS